MQSTHLLISYRLPDGHVLQCVIDFDRGICTEDIDSLACQYFEHTKRMPDRVFMRHDLFYDYMKTTMINSRLSGVPVGGGSFLGVAIWLSIGQIPVVPIVDSYIPLLVGSQQEFDDNNLTKVFEETVLAGCDSE